MMESAADYEAKARACLNQVNGKPVTPIQAETVISAAQVWATLAVAAALEAKP